MYLRGHRVTVQSLFFSPFQPRPDLSDCLNAHRARASPCGAGQQCGDRGPETEGASILGARLPLLLFSELLGVCVFVTPYPSVSSVLTHLSSLPPSLLVSSWPCRLRGLLQLPVPLQPAIPPRAPLCNCFTDQSRSRHARGSKVGPWRQQH